MKKQLLLWMALVCLIATPAFAQSFTQTTQYATSLKTTGSLPACNQPGQVLTYQNDPTTHQNIYVCIDNFKASCPNPNDIITGFNPDGTPACVPNYTAPADCRPQAIVGLNPDGSPICAPFQAAPPICTATQVLNSTDGINFVCKDIAAEHLVSIGGLNAVNGACKADGSNIVIPTNEGSQTGPDYQAIDGTVLVFSEECNYACQTYCANYPTVAAPDFSGGLLVNYAAPTAQCLCFR